MKIINPATEEVIAKVKKDSRQTVDNKFHLLLEGQSAWAAVSLETRIQCIARFYDLIQEQKDELAKTLSSEMGKPLQQSYNELDGARNRLRFFIDHSAAHLAEEWVTPEGSTREKIVYEPLGVIANISAWNYPYLVGINVFIPALIGGNAVLYKPSEYATLTGLHIQRLLHLAGIPQNVFQAVIGKGVVGEYLLDLPLDGYFFTGSYRTGRYIAQRVAPKLVPCQLELGGKDPLYVMDDVENIDTVAGAALEGVMYNNGQSCCAVERIYVHENIFDRFVASYVEQAKQMKTGDPMDLSTGIGPLSRKEQFNFLLSQVEDAVSKGAILLTGEGSLKSTETQVVDLHPKGDKVRGKKDQKKDKALKSSAASKVIKQLKKEDAAGQKGYYFEPAVLINVNHGMKIMTEESFGPVVGIQKVKNDDEATELMLDTDYGLTAAVYSASYERAEAVMKKMNTGTVYWNCCDRVSAGLPWSGRGNSGLGSTLSYQGIRAFVQPKSYHIRG